MKNKGFTHNGSILRSISKLLKAVFMSVGYGMLWTGIVFRAYQWGPAVLVIGAVFTLITVFLSIVIPMSRLK